MPGMDGVRLDGTARNHRRYARPWRGGVYAWMVLRGTIGDVPNLGRPGRERGHPAAGRRSCGRDSPESARLPATGRSNFTQIEGRGGTPMVAGRQAAAMPTVCETT